MRRRLAVGGGQRHYRTSNPSTCYPSEKWQAFRYWAGGKDPGDFSRLGGRQAGRQAGRALQEQQGWGAGPCFLAPSIKIDLPKPCTYRNMSSIPPRDPLSSLTHHGPPARRHAAACRTSLDRLVPTLLDASQPALHLTLQMLQAARREQREHLLRAERQEPRMLAGICSRRLPYPLPTTSTNPCMPGSSLSCAFPLQSYARHQQASKNPSLRDSRLHACIGPRLLVLSLLFRSELKNCYHGQKEGRGGRAGWAGRQQHLPREGIDKEPRNPTDKLAPLDIVHTTAVLARPAFTSAP